MEIADEQDFQGSLSSQTVQLAKLQCPAGADAHKWSDLLLEGGAWYVSVSDGDAGTHNEKPIVIAHPPGSVATSHATWGGPDSWECVLLSPDFNHCTRHEP